LNYNLFRHNVALALLYHKGCYAALIDRGGSFLGGGDGVSPDGRNRRIATANRRDENPRGASGLWGRAAVVKRLGYSRVVRRGCTARASPESRRGGARSASRRCREWPAAPLRARCRAGLPQAKKWAGRSWRDRFRQYREPGRVVGIATRYGATSSPNPRLTVAAPSPSNKSESCRKAERQLVVREFRRIPSRPAPRAARRVDPAFPAIDCGKRNPKFLGELFLGQFELGANCSEQIGGVRWVGHAISDRGVKERHQRRPGWAVRIPSARCEFPQRRPEISLSFPSANRSGTLANRRIRHGNQRDGGGV
jgi:hypothetical protein